MTTKEILERLEKYGQLTPDAIDDLHYIKDYITNLQEENEMLNKECDTYMKISTKKQQRIDKAIKYIEKHTNYFVLGANKEVDEFDYISTSPKALLNILKGEDK